MLDEKDGTEIETGVNMYDLIRAGTKGRIYCKGDYISPEEIERLSTITRQDRRFGIAILNLKTIVTRFFSDQNIVVTIKSESDGLRILTDDEATVYNHELFKQRIQSLLAIHGREQGVDVSQMTVEARQDHDKRIVSQGRFVQAIAATNKTTGLIPYKRPLE